MIETFIDVQGYEGLYTVSNTGKVYNIRLNKFMKPYIDVNGYEAVRLSSPKIDKVYGFKIHRLVLFNFYPALDKNLQVNHIDSNRRNNNLYNLEGVNTRENSSHRSLRVRKTSKHLGVSLDKRCNRWRATIMVKGKQKALGYHSCETAAYFAYLKALKENNLINKYA